MATKANQRISGAEEIVLQQRKVSAVFIICLMLGTIAIVLGTTSENPFVSVVGSVAAMFLYIFIASTGETDLPAAPIADSYYYLGFMLTLIAIVTSLVWLSENESADFNSVVGNVGAALSTTILGLVARLLSTSFSLETNERRQQAERNLESSIHRFTLQMHQAADASSGTMQAISADISKALHDTTEQFLSIQTAYEKRANEKLENMSALATNAMNEILIKLQSIHIDEESLTKPLQNCIDSAALSLMSYSEEIVSSGKEISTNNKELAELVGNSTTHIRNNIVQVNNAITTMLEQQADKYRHSVSQLMEPLTTQLEAAATVTVENSSLIREGATAAHKEIHQLEKSLRMYKTRLEGACEVLDRTVIRLDENLASFGEVGGSIGSASEALQALTDSTIKLSAHQKELSSATSNLISKSESTESDLRSAASKIKGTADSAAQLTNDISTDVKAVYKGLKDSVDKLAT